MEVIPLLPEFGSVRTIFADPPYFLSNDGITCQSGKMVSVNKGKWDRLTSTAAMHEFNTSWLAICRDSLHRNGTLWVSGTHHSIFSVGFAIQQLGIKLLNQITWEKTAPPPNLSCRYFTHSTENIIWAAKSEKSKHHFEYQEMKQMNGGKQMQTMWRIAAHKKSEKTQGKHPTQKPLALLDRIIRASSRMGDMVLDPFSGSGTTGLAAVKLGRRYVGVETEEEYLDLSRKRFEAMVAQPELSL